MTNIDTRGLERISKEICESIEDELNNLNLFFRVFYRYKAEDSLHKKLSKQTKEGAPKYTEQKKIQDVIGIRINLYFADDIEVVYNLFKEKFEFIEETIDKNLETEFKPTRINLIFKIHKKHNREFKDLIPDLRIDNTFELQLRTVLSEGWHEVDHDLRYKCEDDWQKHTDLSRMFNGILAAIETNEWSMLQLFNELSYRHYQNSDCEAMLRTKFRIRLNDQKIKPQLKDILQDQELQKKFFKLERKIFLNYLKEKPLIVPMNLENLVYILNYIFIQDKRILEETPDLILIQLKPTLSKLVV